MKVIINEAAFIKKGFFISTDYNLLDKDMIYEFLDKRSYWSKGITRDSMEKAISNSMVFGIYRHQKQVAMPA